MTLRAAASLSRARVVASDPSSLTRYFEILQDTLEEYDIIGKPNQIFNMDETGMSFEPKHPKGIFPVGDKRPAMFSSGNKGQVTVVGCVSAAGFCMPPMVILDRKTLAPYLTTGEVAGTIYGLSSSGWMDQELFHLWFKNHFLKYIPACRPVLLLMDGHKSHYNPETIRLAATAEIILFTLPPNTTHLSQPLDRSCFGPLKTAWRQACHRFMSCNPGMVVTKHSFSPLFHEAWSNAMTRDNIMSAFRVTGIYPFDPSAVLHDADPKASRLFEESRLPYIPLLTPSRLSRGKERSFFENNDLELSDIDDLPSPLSCSSPYSSYPPSHSCSPPPSGMLLLPRQSSFDDLLKYPTLPERPKVYPEMKKSSRVLTTAENLQLLQQKEKEKEEKARLKEEKKVAREI